MDLSIVATAAAVVLDIVSAVSAVSAATVWIQWIQMRGSSVADPSLESYVAIAKIAVPALGAWLAAWLTNRRERLQWMAKQTAQQHAELSQQSDRLTAGWAEMTTQAREIITRLQVETIDAKTRCATAEERSAALGKELADITRKYEQALEELEGLREKVNARERRRRERPDET